MSIIYDALQKTQRARRENRDVFPEKNVNLPHRVINAVVKIAVVVLAVVIAYIYLPLISKHFSVKPAHRHARAVAAPVTVAPTATVAPDTVAVAETVAQPEATDAVPPTETPATAPTVAGLNLTGVMLAGQNSVAIINNHSYQLGDVINGMKVIGIEINRVQLLNGQQIVVLRSAG